MTDGLPALCLATDPIDRDVMRRPPRRRGEALADRGTVGWIVLTGVLTAAATIAAYLYGLRFEGAEQARTHAFAVLVFAELLRAFSGRSETKPIWRMSPFENVRLSAVVAASFALQLGAHHVEPLRAALRAGSLPWSECAALVGVALAPVMLLELVKVARARRRAERA